MPMQFTCPLPPSRMPAYYRNRWYSIVFIIFIVLCMYIFLSIVLAVVYNNFRKHLKVGW